MTKWEYATCSEPPVRELNEYGRNGWELVAVHGPVHVFKRPLGEPKVIFSTETRKPGQ